MELSCPVTTGMFCYRREELSRASVLSLYPCKSVASEPTTTDIKMKQSCRTYYYY